MSIVEPRIFQFSDKLEFEVHPDREKIKVTMGKETTFVTKAEMWAFVFAISDGDKQDDLIPVRQTELSTFRKIHRVKVTKPLKPGDFLNFKCEVNVPTTVVEGLSGLVKKAAKNPIHIIGGKK